MYLGSSQRLILYSLSYPYILHGHPLIEINRRKKVQVGIEVEVMVKKELKQQLSDLIKTKNNQRQIDRVVASVFF